MAFRTICFSTLTETVMTASAVRFCDVIFFITFVCFVVTKVGTASLNALCN